jgi:3'(2'), 5'-bisphosphate nucleotidase
VIYAPALGKMYYAVRDRGSYLISGGKTAQKIYANSILHGDKLIIVGSRSHATQELEQYVNEQKKNHREVEFIAAGSAMKFCLIAEGKADIYPRTGPTMEWDTAAGHALVLESGKQVYEFGLDSPLRYNKRNLRNGWFIVR